MKKLKGCLMWFLIIAFVLIIFVYMFDDTIADYIPDPPSD